MLGSAYCSRQGEVGGGGLSSVVYTVGVVGERHRTLEREKKRAMDALRALDEELRIARQESADAKKQVGHDEARCT